MLAMAGGSGYDGERRCPGSSAPLAGFSPVPTSAAGATAKERDEVDKRMSVMSRSILAGLGALLFAGAPLGACGKSEPAPESAGGVALKDPAPAASEPETTTGEADAVAAPDTITPSEAAIPGGPPPVPHRPGLRQEPTPRRAAGPAPLRPVIQTSAGTEPPPPSAMQPPGAPGAVPPTPEEATAAAVRPTPPTITAAGGAEPGERPATATRPAPMPTKASPPPEVAPDDAEVEPPALAGTATPPAGARASAKVGGPTEPPLDIERYLPLEVVREIVGAPQIMPTGPLAGLPASPHYNSAHFAPPGGKGFGVSLQVWQEVSRLAVNERFRRAKRQYPHAQETRALEPAKAFFSYFGKLQALTFMDSDKQLVVSVTCAETVCSQDKLLQLAKRARQAL